MDEETNQSFRPTSTHENIHFLSVTISEALVPSTRVNNYCSALDLLQIIERLFFFCFYRGKKQLSWPPLAADSNFRNSEYLNSSGAAKDSFRNFYWNCSLILSIFLEDHLYTSLIGSVSNSHFPEKQSLSNHFHKCCFQQLLSHDVFVGVFLWFLFIRHFSHFSPLAFR